MTKQQQSRGTAIMHPLLRPTNLIIAALGVVVVGLGTVVAADHASAPAARPAQTASVPAANAAASLLASGAFGAASQFRGEASHVFDFFTRDTGLTWNQIGAELLGGKTLGQIAGARSAKVEADALAEVKAGLSLGVAKGGITAAEETRLVADARDAISVLMAAKLSALLPSGH